MENEAETLFREVEALPKQGRRRLYAADLRRRVVAFVEKVWCHEMGDTSVPGHG